ncbi:MAG: hypothetical protein O7G85_04775 [Planctomycetota bacterium]|nr:hypothetical protein [Planctomycetota bacterium]
MSILILTMMKHVITLLKNPFSLFVALMLAFPIEVLAQVAPTPVIRNAPKAWMGMVPMIVLGFIVVLVSMIPSKRGHQD